MKLVIQNVSYDSMDEWYFSRWCAELQQRGFIEYFQRNLSVIPITEGLYNKYLLETQLKTKVKIEEKNQAILRPSEYTPDFFISWTERANGLLFQRLDENKLIKPSMIIAQDSVNAAYSHIECKPLYDRDNMGRLFVLNQKFIWDKYKKFINLVYPVVLFSNTFAPSEFMLTPTGKPRKFSKPYLNIEQWLENC